MAIFKGTSGKDTFIGTSQNDSFLYIGAGDTADGGAGSDILSLSLTDVTSAIAYNAIAAATTTGVTIAGTTIRNMERLGSLQTGKGDDVLTVSVAQGPFTWDAGAGNDILRIDFSKATDYVFSSVAPDSFSFHAQQWNALDFTTALNVESVQIFGSRFNDYFIGGAGNDILRGGAGDDVLDPGSAGKDLIDGQAGFDRIELNYASETASLTYDATVAATATGGRLFNGVLVKNVEGIRSITTGSGNDKLIVDSATRDFVWNPGAGTDMLIADYSDATGPVHSVYAVSPYGPLAAITTPSMMPGFTAEAFGLEQLFITGSKFGDSLQGTWGNDRLDGSAGSDVLEGLKGDDTYVVDNIGDHINELMDQGTDTVYASVDFSLSGAYLDYLILTGHHDIYGFGNDLDNRIFGNSGDNRIVGGRGNDVLKGGAGADTFAFAAGSGYDRILDFSTAQGDRLDLNAYHAKSTAVITQHGADTWVDLGAGNVIVLSNVTASDENLQSHIVW